MQHLIQQSQDSIHATHTQANAWHTYHAIDGRRIGGKMSSLKPTRIQEKLQGSLQQQQQQQQTKPCPTRRGRLHG